MNTVRRLGALERVWMAADRMAPPFVISLVIEGTGTLTLQELQASVDSVVSRHPWLCAKLIGALTTCRWTDRGNPPSVTEFSVPNWNGEDATPLIPWDEKISPTQGDTLSVWLVNSEVTRIIFRASHAFMDGKALLAFADAVGEGLSGLHDTTLKQAVLTDVSAARMTGAIPEKEQAKSRHPFRDAPTQATGTLWRRRRMALPSGHLLARVAIALKTFSTDTTQFLVEIPVNLRPALGLAHDIGNLTGLLRLPIVSEDPGQTHANIATALSKNKHLSPILTAHALRFVPIATLTHIGRRSYQQETKTQEYLFGATISNLGLTDLSKFIGPSFQATTCYWIPPHSPSNPLLIIMSGGKSHLEITARAPCALGDNGRLDRLLDHIVNNLTPTAPS